MAGFVIRLATDSDAADVNAVYNPFIRESAATFETEEYSLAQRQGWISARAGDPRYPVLVAVSKSGDLCGFANASPFDQRDGYRSSVKTSVFVTPSWQGKGVASALYRVLFDRLEGADLHRAYALIVAPNPASVALHEAFGFAYLMTLNEVGRKFEHYHDVMWFEKHL